MKRFKRELENRAILDVGCGNAAFLKCVARHIRYKRLVGLDVDARPWEDDEIASYRKNIIDFGLGETFVVVWSSPKTSVSVFENR